MPAIGYTPSQVIKAAPKAPAKPPAAPVRTSTATGNNPRGVSITALSKPTVNDKKVVAQTIARAAAGTPRGTAVAQPPSRPTVNDAQAIKQAVIRATKPKISPVAMGIGLPADAAAIEHPGISLAALQAPHGILQRFVQGALETPKNVAETIGAVGGAAAHDITHPADYMPDFVDPFGVGYGKLLLHNQPTALQKLSRQTVSSDPLVQSVVHGSLKPVSQNPWGTAMDLATLATGAGELAGEGARAAGGTSDLVTGIRDQRAMPGDVMPVERTGSSNLLKNFVKTVGDKIIDQVAPKPGTKFAGISLNPIDREFERRADEHIMVQHNLRQRYETRAHGEAKALGLGPQEEMKLVNTKRQLADRHAMNDLYESNALKNPRTGAVFYSKGTEPKALDDLAAEGHTFVKTPVGRSLSDKPSTKNVFLPKPLTDRLASHANYEPGKSDIGAQWQRVTRNFRAAALPFSARWMVEHSAEGVLRTLAEGVGPQHSAWADKLDRDMRTEGGGIEADRLQAHTQQGMYFTHNQEINRDISAKVQSDAAKGKLLFPPKVRAVARAPRTLAEKSFAINAKPEMAFTKATLGKHVQDFFNTVKATNPGITDEAAWQHTVKSYHDPDMAANAGRYVRSVIGKYSAFSPKGRMVHDQIAPFSPWYTNAAKFTASAPLKHPALSAALQDIGHSQDAQWNAEHKGQPGYDSLEPEISPGHFTNVLRYNPWGLAQDVAGVHTPWQMLAQEAGSLIAPQVSTTVKNVIANEDEYGNPLKWPGPASKLTPTGKLSTSKYHEATTNQGQGFWTGLSNLLEGQVPLASQAQQILVNRGGTPYNTNKLWDLNPTMKSGKQGPLTPAEIFGALLHQINPVPGQTSAPAKAKTTSTYNWGGTSSTTGSGSSSYNWGAPGALPHGVSLARPVGAPQPGKLAAAASEAASLLRDEFTRNAAYNPLAPVSPAGPDNPAEMAANDIQYRGDYANAFAALQHAGIVAKNAKLPPLIFAKGGPNGPQDMRPYEMGSKANDNARVITNPQNVWAATQTDSPIHAWGEETPIHELVHTQQSAHTLASIPLREGGAQAVADAIAPRAVGPISEDDTNYTKFVDAIRKLGSEYYMRKQF